MSDRNKKGKCLYKFQLGENKGKICGLQTYGDKCLCSKHVQRKNASEELRTKKYSQHDAEDSKKINTQKEEDNDSGDDEDEENSNESSITEESGVLNKDEEVKRKSEEDKLQKAQEEVDKNLEKKRIADGVEEEEKKSHKEKKEDKSQEDNKEEKKEKIPNIIYAPNPMDLLDEEDEEDTKHNVKNDMLPVIRQMYEQNQKLQMFLPFEEGLRKYKNNQKEWKKQLTELTNSGLKTGVCKFAVGGVSMFIEGFCGRFGVNLQGYSSVMMLNKEANSAMNEIITLYIGDKFQSPFARLLLSFGTGAMTVYGINKRNGEVPQENTPQNTSPNIVVNRTQQNNKKETKDLTYEEVTNLM
jgi:hypothetical protein